MNQEEQPGWDYKPSDKTAVAEEPHPISGGPKASAPPGASAPPPKKPSSLTWTAAEFLEHDRGLGWYLLLIGATVIVAAIAWVALKDYFAVGITIAVGIIMAFAVRHKPGQVQYELTDSGINVGNKAYKYSEFKSFTIIHEMNTSSLEFIPLKKLMLPVAAFINPADEERIIDIVGSHLPYEERNMAAFDRLSRRLRL